MAGEDQSVAALLRALRDRSGLSQEELAERAGLSSHAVSALERGTRTRPYPHTIRALSEALGASEDERSALIAAVPTRGRSPQRPADASSRRRDLPVPPTPLLGREEELARTLDLVRTQRLVTLTGAGGVGKTRLGLAAATRLRDRYADGIVYVELAAVLDAQAALLAVADAVEAGPPGGTDPVEAIAAQLHARELLLVLDNCEHVLDIATGVSTLIESVPGLTVLATSRAPLRVRAETELAVEPLALPAAADTDGPAVRLLLERAHAAVPGWGTAAEDAAAVATICRRLDGLPLAIELAAARVRLLDPAALLERLDDAMTAGPRDLPERQRTMRATLDWSYGLLADDERRMLRLLSAFVGGFRIEDLEQVAGRAGFDEAATLHALAALDEHSLVTGEAGTGSTRRYRLLEPVAQYAREQLRAEGEAPSAYAAHLDHYLALAEQAAPHYRDGEQVTWLARIDDEHPNLAAAAERGLEAGEGTRVGRLAWALWMYWWLRGHHAHGRRLAEAALRHELPAEVVPRAELAAATMSFAMDDIAASRAWWLRAEAHALAGTDLVAQTNAVSGVGLADLADGDLAAARSQFERSLPLAEQAGQPAEWTWALTRIWLGTIALLLGEPEGAVDHIEEGLASARRRGDRLTIYIALYNLSQVALQRGRHDEARGHLDEGMRLSLETGDLANLAYFLDAMAVLETAETMLSRVPLLLGAAQAIRELIGARGYHYYRPDPDAIATAAEQARRHLGGDRYDDALDHGRGLPPHEAVTLALGDRASG